MDLMGLLWLVARSETNTLENSKITSIWLELLDIFAVEANYAILSRSNTTILKH